MKVISIINNLIFPQNIKEIINNNFIIYIVGVFTDNNL